jgi:S-adenosylmethionine/arginine decarboxylase-like enzyme
MIYIDVFCCATNFDPEFCAVIIEQEFSAQKGVWKIISREIQNK